MNRGANPMAARRWECPCEKRTACSRADLECRSSVPGLFEAGDALGNMQNGAAYSLGGGSICGGAVTGTIAAEAAAREAAAMEMPQIAQQELDRAAAFVLEPLTRKGGFGPRWVMDLLRNYMMPYFIYFIKKADRLEATLTLIEFMESHIAPMIYAAGPHELRLAHEAKNMILSAKMLPEIRFVPYGEPGKPLSGGLPEPG